MVYSLWATGSFLPWLVGSVIEFIHIGDLQKILTESAEGLPRLEKEIATLQKFFQLETKLKKQMQLIQSGRRMLCDRFQRMAS
jgi:hypothetical protein